MRTAAITLALLAAGLATGCGPREVEILPQAALTAETPVEAPRATQPAPASPSPTATVTPASPGLLAGIRCEWASVTGVTDGDTLDVRFEDGTAGPVRLIGVDAPEGGQALAAEAQAYLTSLIDGPLCLEMDVTDRDGLGRLLRYAWRRDGTLLNEAMVAAGLALVVTYPPDTKYVTSRYEPAVAQARAAGRGLWAASPTPAAQAQAGPDETPAAAEECDPSYPDVCIPPVSVAGDLNCGDIPHRRFRVLPPDPHRFDGNRDGVGCEG